VEISIKKLPGANIHREFFKKLLAIFVATVVIVVLVVVFWAASWLVAFIVVFIIHYANLLSWGYVATKPIIFKLLKIYT